MKNLVLEYRNVERSCNEVDPYQPRTKEVEDLNEMRISIYKKIVEKLHEIYPSGEVPGFWVTTQSSCAFFIDRNEAATFSEMNHPYGMLRAGTIRLNADGFFWSAIVRIAEKIAV